MKTASSLESIADAARRLAQGELVAFPTETVYGLGANALDPQAVAQIYEVKGRPATNPLILHVASAADVPRWIRQPLADRQAQQLARLESFWPGPLTVVLPKSPQVPDVVTAGQDTVAIRVPDHPVAHALLARCPFPVAAPSANRSTHVSPTTATHVRDEFGDAVPCVLEGGASRCGLESTIVSLCHDPPRLLRPGTITAEQLADVLNVSVADLTGDTSATTGQPATIQVPGTARLHYAPRLPVCLLPDWQAAPRAGRWALLALGPVSESVSHDFVHVEVLSQTRDLDEVARRLYAALRELDQPTYSGLVIETCDEVGTGRAIMDRVRRAAAGRVALSSSKPKES